MNIQWGGVGGPDLTPDEELTLTLTSECPYIALFLIERGGGAVNNVIIRAQEPGYDGG